jgi:succinate dehydrogenase/fumarate reductase-like Fe-S protein
MNAPVTKSEKTAPITIQRGAPGEEPWMETYDVPWRPGMSVLDAIVWVRTHADSSVAFRYSCVSANACKECMVAVNGKTVYACTERLAEGGTDVGPLKNKTLIRDLVTDIVPPKENLRTILAEREKG